MFLLRTGMGLRASHVEIAQMIIAPRAKKPVAMIASWQLKMTTRAVLIASLQNVKYVETGETGVIAKLVDATGTCAIHARTTVHIATNMHLHV